MQFKCNSCGQVTDVPQRGAEGSTDCVGPDEPPDGWRTIWTMIQVSDGQGGMETSAGEVLHSCDECSRNLDVDEHHEAEFETRKQRMGGAK